MGSPGRTLAGRSVHHAEAAVPWPERRPLCDRTLARIRVRLVRCEAGTHPVTCRRCLRIAAALEQRTS